MNKRDLYLKHVAQTSSLSMLFEVDRAEGMYIWNTNGQKYLDLNSGISVSSIGHRNPKVINAIKNQLDKHLHTMVYGEHIHETQVQFASLLFNQVPESLNSIYYFMSGTEVLEAAMKLVRKKTNRFEIIACENAYHGSSIGAESLRSDHDYGMGFRPMVPGVRHIEFNNFEDLKKITNKTAAVILEPVQAEAGIINPHPCYLEAVKLQCEKTGTLMVLDEIQTGFGRTGSLFAFQKFNVIPDILCIGKAMGGGMPIGGLVSSKEILSSFIKNPALGHISTFSGHPVSCAAAHACLEELLENDIIHEVLEKEALFKSKLIHPIIKEHRSSGLMMSVELTRRKYLKHVVKNIFDQQALVDYFLFNDKSFRLAPPLIISKQEIELACDIILKACDYAQAKYLK